VSVWTPDISHPLLLVLITDEELVVPPRSTATTEGAFRHANVLWGLVVVLPHCDEAFGEKKEQGCENGLILSGKFPSFEDVVIVIREVGFTPPRNGIRLSAEE